VTESSEETFERVVESLEEWQPDADETGSTHRIRERLDYELNANAESPWDRAVVELSGGSLAGDVVVDGQVGIVLLDTNDVAHVPSVAARLNVLGEHFNYLVVYWWSVNPETADHRRVVERRYSASALGVADIAYLDRPEIHENQTSWFPSPGAGIMTLAFITGVATLLTITIGAARAGSVIEAPLARTLLAATGLLFLGTLSLAVAVTR
jgi:hypothetical protein